MRKQKGKKMDREKVILARHTLEIRYEATGTFLDVRGYVADYIKEKGLFPHWKIEPNTVSFRDDRDKVIKDGAFAGYKNAGYFVINPDTRNYFVNKATSYWKTLVDNKHYAIPKLTRFGCRTLAFIPTEMNFIDLNNIVFNAFYTEKAKALISGTEEDLQFIFDLVEGHFQVKLSGGPLHEKEALNLMNFESEYFEKCGLFIDIDYYKTEDINQKSVIKLLNESTNFSWEKIENMANSLEL
ncbi:hypothetical protein ACFLTB_04830 [Chloroflexota bacterium]